MASFICTISYINYDYYYIMYIQKHIYTLLFFFLLFHIFSTICVASLRNIHMDGCYNFQVSNTFQHLHILSLRIVDCNIQLGHDDRSIHNNLDHPPKVQLSFGPTVATGHFVRAGITASHVVSLLINFSSCGIQKGSGKFNNLLVCP